MNILNKIVAHKVEEIKKKKKNISYLSLKSLPYYNENTISLKKRLIDTPRKIGIIAEMKKASPSKGLLANSYNPRELFYNYREAKVEGISVLTDEKFFLGSIEHLFQVRSLTESIPLLRKDFIIDPYQVEEAKGYGASVVLLIAAILDEKQYQELYLQAKELDLEVITEIHNAGELQKVFKYIEPEIIGINNRDLTTFKTSIDNTIKLYQQIPKETVLISESGIQTKDQVLLLETLGVKGILVGEHLVKSKEIVETINHLAGKI